MSATTETPKPNLLELLWRAAPESGRGPRKGLTVDEVVTAAIALADAEGLEAVTVRRLAQELGKAPMTLYTYVPGKTELVALMLDALFVGMERSPTTGAWRERLTAVARGNYGLYREHPWAAAASPSRPPLGPGQCAKYEHELQALEGLGLSDVEMDDALAYLLAFVRTAAQDAAQSEAERATSGMDDQEWWEANGPLLAKVLDPERYPTAVRVGQAAGEAHDAAYNAEHAFAFGLARTLDGLAALIER
ncbi:TetR/AcrR family transcriptional regulator C-terminal domain-containing protein [Glycomyces algeriensis]|uniref:TetR family transcriptional regulator n=1 Tax=Glycomyces algeriensis TaxID=256037 RepID=A0A9W6G6K1_9ACTN|nr:TetR/AcrR family transcriptional regulator C-terminal domain-containing protein [Glycomyces algeriensis]MDA1366385.1 TetR/AcrR family transcriptional regulator C-terminal domain-containing protein [Glycomyces algeriensis]MDR7348734.1 AcrR family transcriptional regulator [Glycomyces algeriensis]GLI41436.1 TetR family transcriptional regulator [Glycomyces algeriensis]